MAVARPTRLVVEPVLGRSGAQQTADAGQPDEEVTADVLTFDGGVLRAWLEGELVGETPMASVGRILLRGSEPAMVRARARHAKAYQPWTAQDDDVLRAAHEAGTPLAELVPVLGRNESALSSRLARLGLLPPPDYSSGGPTPGGDERYGKAGQSWAAADDDELRDRYVKGEDIDSLAVHFGRSTGAIRSRLARLGLEAGSPAAGAATADDASEVGETGLRGRLQADARSPTTEG
jgi:hypothetical protein